MKLRTKAVALLFFTAVLSSCSVMQAYPGPRLPPEQIARIEDSFSEWVFWARAVSLESLDGRCVTTRNLEVLPGSHVVGVTYMSAKVVVISMSQSPCFVTFNAEPGHTYQVDGEDSLLKKGWHCWIEDVRTKKRTDGVPKPPAHLTLAPELPWRCTEAATAN